MKQFILAVSINSVQDYCTAVLESEALEVLQCVTELGIKARLEYDYLPFGVIPKKFNWVVFIVEYKELTKRYYLS